MREEQKRSPPPISEKLYRLRAENLDEWKINKMTNCSTGNTRSLA